MPMTAAMWTCLPSAVPLRKGGQGGCFFLFSAPSTVGTPFVEKGRGNNPRTPFSKGDLGRGNTPLDPLSRGDVGDNPLAPFSKGDLGRGNTPLDPLSRGDVGDNPLAPFSKGESVYVA